MSFHTLIVGCGLAGLAAARDLEHRGARVTTIDARDRVGGRTWTIRDGFGGQHAEAGADLIESRQTAVLALAKSVGLTPVRILRRGFGFHGLTRQGRTAIQRIDAHMGALLQPFAEAIREYQVSEHRWDSAVAQDLSRQSAAGLLARAEAPEWVRARFCGLRGLFLADPEDLSALAVVDFFAETDAPGQDTMYRIAEGNDAVASRIADGLADRPRLRTVLRRVRATRRRITATVEDRSGRHELDADFIIIAIPAVHASGVIFQPELPDQQEDALRTLRYGAASRLLLQFEDRFWQRAGRASAYGTSGPLGAVWDGNEQQRGRRGILSLLAGGHASRELQTIVRSRVEAVVPHLRWLGRPAPLAASRLVVWEDDPWARGGYAFFHAGFNPLLRDWLARPAGRVLFAGEHTSQRWQGYMNGAVESGLRAAAEAAALARR